MLQKHKIALLTTGLVLLAGQAMAGSPATTNCTSCHEAKKDVIWGTIVPGSQTDSSVKIANGSDVVTVRYDNKSDLDGFKNVRELRDEKAVSVTVSRDLEDRFYAEEMNYKPSYHLHTLDNIITISEVGQTLQQSPEEGNYMIVDARGYDNFIEGHLPNAVNIPYYRLQEFKDRLPKDKNTKIIAYCRGFT